MLDAIILASRRLLVQYQLGYRVLKCWGCGSAVELLPSMHETLGPITSPANRLNERRTKAFSVKGADWGNTWKYFC